MPITSIEQSATTTLNVSLIPEEKIGFPRYLSLPYYPNPPVIDGYISEGATPVDAGWRAASRYAMSTGVTTSPVSFQGMKSASGDALYMSFEVRNDDTIDAEDAIVLAFRPDYSTTDNAVKTTAFRTNDVVMFVYPLSTAGGASGTATVTDYEVWQYNGTTWDDVTSSYSPTMAVHWFDYESKKAWDVEMRLPLGSAPMAINDQFYFYYDVLRVSSTAPGVVEYFWPRQSKNIGTILRPSALYAGSWSKADKTTGVALDGVWCDWNATKVTPANPNHPADDFYITFEPTGGSARENTFTTTVKNDRQITTDSGTSYVDSPGVRVLLRIANWGIAGANPGPDWSELDALFTSSGGTVNPSPAQTVNQATGPGSPGTATFVYSCMVGPEDALPTNIAAYHHQCIYTELTANDEVYVKSKGVYRNMNFDHASELRREAVISTRGFGKTPKGRSTFRYILSTSRREWVRRDDSASRTLPGRAPNAPAPLGAAANNNPETQSYLDWEINGYLCTGNYLVIRGKPYEILNATGSFGYIVEHDAEVAAWDPHIEGARLTGDGAYELEIPAESAATIVTVVKPVDFTPVALSLHGGVAFPLANFSATYGMGFCAMLDVEYAITPNLGLVLLAGFSYLPGASALILPTNFINLNLDARFTLPFGRTLYAYAQAGPGVYVQDLDFSTIVPGFNVGLGAGLILSPRFKLELGADSHSTFTIQNWLLQAHLGIIMRL
ncbi:MAG: hypothetical protein JXD23_01780 [Spirochaetales bacterium]|nr:hypothetical protein [Spirochaetales bacterium]